MDKTREFLISWAKSYSDGPWRFRYKHVNREIARLSVLDFFMQPEKSDYALRHCWRYLSVRDAFRCMWE
jgi:hypothetical protein